MGDRLEDSVSSLIPVTILTGFLGSGKTTLLSRLIERSALPRTLVIINEFGEIGLDKDLLIEDEDNIIVQMEDGCVCCSIQHLRSPEPPSHKLSPPPSALA